MNTVIAIFQKGKWIQVWNVDYAQACQEARDDPEKREIAFIPGDDKSIIVHQAWQAEEDPNTP